jgi:hypothetical protein
MKDWYKVRFTDVASKHGSGLLTMYDSSVSKALATVYPEHDWKPWMFTEAPKHFWDQKSNIDVFVNSLRTDLGIERNDWTSIHI